METVQQNGRFTLFSSKFLSIYFILYVFHTRSIEDDMQLQAPQIYSLNYIYFIDP